MADIKWKAPTVALTSYLTPNGLVADTTLLGAAIDNTTNLCTHMDLELKLGAIDLTSQSNPAIVVYILESLDGGTIYETGDTGVSAEASMPAANKVLYTFGLRKGTGSEVKYAMVTGLQITGCHFKLMLRNKAGVTLNAANNTFSYRTYIWQSV